MSQIIKTSSGGGGGGVTSVTGIDGIIVTPTTGGAVVSTNPPNAYIAISDDFIGAQITLAGTTLLNSNYSWGPGTNSGSVIPIPEATLDNGHPGLLSVFLAPNSQNVCISSLCEGQLVNNAFILGGGVITLNWVFNILALSSSFQEYTLRLGFGDTEGVDQANGCYFEYSETINSGQWNIKTASVSVRTTINTTTVASLGWHNAQITINANASSVNFTLDGISLGNITTHIPTSAINMMMDWISGAGINEDTEVAHIDLMYLTQQLTIPR